MDDVYNGLNIGKKVSGIFLDIKKAFDTVDHEILLNKLFDCGVRGNVYLWFQSYLTNRKQSVRINNTFSALGPINSGVPQGSVLGSILFLIYINDLCNANLVGKITSFADDTALCYVKDNWQDIEQSMTSDLKALQWWFTKNNMLLSPEKTKFINFGLKNDTVFSNKIMYKCIECLCKNTQCNSQCAVINQTDNIKYLGLILDKEISWKKHITLLKNKLNSTLRYFYFLRRICPENVLRMLYFSLVNSRLEYGLFCWGGAYDAYLKPVIIQQKKFIRIIKKKGKMEPSKPLFQTLNILPLHYMFLYKVLRIFYTVSGNLPQLNKVYKNKLRSIERVLVTKPNLTFFKKSYCYLGPKFFCDIPQVIAEARNLFLFSKQLKNWIVNSNEVELMLLRVKV
uniref:Reverse transcriptase domain-containing protein n=2 Tax=Graphocephala atropunctata TaxID=36148 RepID=A0A1B6LTK9_9HEMI